MPITLGNFLFLCLDDIGCHQLTSPLVIFYFIWFFTLGVFPSVPTLLCRSLHKEFKLTNRLSF